MVYNYSQFDLFKEFCQRFLKKFSEDFYQAVFLAHLRLALFP